MLIHLMDMCMKVYYMYYIMHEEMPVDYSSLEMAPMTTNTTPNINFRIKKVLEEKGISPYASGEKT